MACAGKSTPSRGGAGMRLAPRHLARAGLLLLLAACSASAVTVSVKVFMANGVYDGTTEPIVVSVYGATSWEPMASTEFVDGAPHGGLARRGGARAEPRGGLRQGPSGWPSRPRRSRSAPGRPMARRLLRIPFHLPLNSRAIS
jgi:hypothetical protein